MLLTQRIDQMQTIDREYCKNGRSACGYVLHFSRWAVADMLFNISADEMLLGEVIEFVPEEPIPHPDCQTRMEENMEESRVC